MDWFAVFGVGSGILGLQLLDVVLKPYGIFVWATPLASTSFAIFTTRKSPRLRQISAAHSMGALVTQIVLAVGHKLSLSSMLALDQVLSGAATTFAMSMLGIPHAPAAAYSVMASENDAIIGLGLRSLLWPAPLGSALLVTWHHFLTRMIELWPAILARANGRTNSISRV